MSKLRAVILTAIIAFPVGAFAASPVKNHPNLEAADKALTTALRKITAAQKANEWDMDGHAAKAKAALDSAADEIKLAAEAAKENK